MFVFCRGQFIDDIETEVEWEDGEEESKFLEKLGFFSALHIPQSFADNEDLIEIYSHTNGSFCVSGGIGDTPQHVIASDFPSLLMLLKLYSIIIQAESHLVLSAIDYKLEKFFRLYHGHSSYFPCQKCDPDEFKRMQEITQRMKKLNIKDKL